MIAYSIYNKNETFATILTDLKNEDEFQVILHRFQSNLDFIDATPPTLEDFKAHLISLGYKCEVFKTHAECKWWVED